MVTLDEDSQIYRTDIAVSRESSLNKATLDIVKQVRKFFIIDKLISLSSKWDTQLFPGNYNNLEDLADDLSEVYIKYPPYFQQGPKEIQKIIQVGLIKVYNITDNNVKLIYNI